MDELKLLIEMVANLPTLAVWVLVGYLVYKIAVIGSIYGLLRFAIEKLHSWLTSSTPRSYDPTKSVKLIPGASPALVVQLHRIKKNSDYIHESDVDWLKKVLDAALVDRKY